MQVGRGNAALEHIYLYSVPGLKMVKGLSELPATLTHFQLMTKAIKGRDAHNAQVRAKGLIPNVHRDSQFFYK